MPVSSLNALSPSRECCYVVSEMFEKRGLIIKRAAVPLEVHLPSPLSSAKKRHTQIVSAER